MASKYPRYFERTEEGAVEITRERFLALIGKKNIGSLQGIYFEKDPMGRPNGTIAFMVSDGEEERVLMEQFKKNKEAA